MATYRRDQDNWQNPEGRKARRSAGSAVNVNLKTGKALGITGSPSILAPRRRGDRIKRREFIAQISDRADHRRSPPPRKNRILRGRLRQRARRWCRMVWVEGGRDRVRAAALDPQRPLASIGSNDKCCPIAAVHLRLEDRRDRVVCGPRDRCGCRGPCAESGRSHLTTRP